MPGATIDSFQRSAWLPGQFLGAYTASLDIEGHLLSKGKVEQEFPNLKCFRWRGSSFVIDPDVKTVQDVIDYPMVSTLCVVLGRSDTYVCRARKEYLYHLPCQWSLRTSYPQSGVIRRL
jgi:hypothetical protein